MNRKEFFKVSAAASLASLLSPLSAYAEKFESEGKKVKVAVIGCGSVEIVATDAGFARDASAWCDTTGNTDSSIVGVTK